MDYEEANDAIVCRKKVKAEVERHGCDLGELIKDLGEREDYLGREVLEWLGY